MDLREYARLLYEHAAREAGTGTTGQVRLSRQWGIGRRL
jgi:hypothetical protein